MYNENEKKLLTFLNNTVINNRSILNELFKKYPNVDIQFKVLGDIRCQYNEPSLCEITRYEIKKLAYVNDNYMDIYEVRRLLYEALRFSVHGLASDELETMIEKEINRLEFKEYIYIYIQKK